jgi:hypothetical protein
MAKDYILWFDAAGGKRETFGVPEGKHLYLTRAEAVSEGAATVSNVTANQAYVLDDGDTVIEILNPPAQVTLAFTRRTNEKITFVMATVKST